MMYNYYCAYDKYNYYLNVIKSIFDLEQCDFENRYIVHRAFLEHPSVFIKALFQYKIYNCRDWIRNDRYSIFISEDRNIPFGLWKDNVMTQIGIFHKLLFLLNKQNLYEQ